MRLHSGRMVGSSEVILGLAGYFRGGPSLGRNLRNCQRQTSQKPTAPEWQRESAPASEMLLDKGLHALVQFMPSALREEGSRAL